MKLSSTLSTIILALGLATTGCGKKKDAPADKPAEAAKPSEAKGAGEAKPDEAKPDEAKPAAAPAAAPSGALASDDEYIATGREMLGNVLEAFKASGTDCDALAKRLDALSADPKFAAINAYEAAHPEAKDKFMAATEDQMGKFMEVMGPALGACKDHQGVVDATGKMGS